MNKLTAADTLRLSIPERIQLVEDIWDTIASQAELVDLTEEEKNLLDERLTAYHQNPAAGSLGNGPSPNNRLIWPSI